nr:helix-turn-helix transcriptional regulator [Candidatus Sigynarchaeota archaeon]
MFSLRKAFEYKGKPVSLSTHEFITLLKIRMATPPGISGYKLIADLGKVFAGSWSPQSGTIYPILKRLAEIKNLIVEREEKTPIGPTAKIYQLKDELRKPIDDLVLANYQQDFKFFGNYVEFLAGNIETSVKSGSIPAEIGNEMIDVVSELITKLESVKERLRAVKDIEPGSILKCKHCGVEIDRVARFCPNCGKEVNN